MAGNPRIDDLRKKLEKDPGSRLFGQLAEELRKDGELEEAIRVAREGLQKHPAYPSARMTLGRSLLDTGDFQAARSEFEQVLKGAPDNILASRFLAQCLESLDDVPGAVARYKATLLMAPGDKQLLGRLEALASGAKSAASPGARVSAPPAPSPLEFEATLPPGSLVAPAPAAAAAPPTAAPPLEPPPIPLVAADEEFELERPYEAPVFRGGEKDRGVPPVSTNELALERPHVAPQAQWGGGAAPTAPADEVEDQEFDPGLSTLPFGQAPKPAPTFRTDLLAEAAREEERSAGASAPSLAAPSVAAPPIVAPPPVPMRPSPPAANLQAERGAVVPSRVVHLDAPSGSTPRAVPEREALAPAARAAEALPAPAAEEASQAVASATLAEIYFNQGLVEKAVAVYRELVQRGPSNARVVARLAELEAAPSVRTDPVAARRQQVERTISRLEGFLAAVKRG